MLDEADEPCYMHAMHDFFSPYQEEIQRLCKESGVVTLYSFGSVLRDDFSESSDVDLLVVFSREAGGNAFHRYFNFKESLETLFGRKVDLVCLNAIKNRFLKKEVTERRELLYAA